ncbi:MAG TPA: hypothetical protein VFN44_18065 [Solirubrobacteraceae bacterium]|nr:hypothetical protein [Solirubrobacteraceae bacterium]
MRRAARLMAICGCMGILGGCGGAEKAAEKVEKAVDPVAQAAEKTTASGGARMIGGMKMRVEGLTVPLTINGEVSFDDQALQMRMNMGQIKGASPADMAAGRREGGFPIELVQLPDHVFVSTGQVREKGKKDGVEWIRLDLEELDDEAGLDLQRANQYSEVNPDAMLRFLRTTGDARKTGTATVRGERTERYEGTIDLQRYPDLVPEKDKAAARRTVDVMVKSWGGTKHPISVFINDDGVIVREKMPIDFEDGGDRVKGMMVIDLVDVGSPQEIELPDRDEVVDVTDEAAKHFGG